MKLIKNKNKLSHPTKPCESVEAGESIATTLIQSLDVLGGIGLAANQLGINSSVCVVRARKDSPPMTLINPKIVEQSNDKVIYIEGCLSLPHKMVKTIRSKTIKVSCDNWANDIEFGPDGELTADEYWNNIGLLECVCIQHEIDHLNGKLMTDSDRRYVEQPIKIIKYERNEKVMIEKEGKTQFIKYKKALPLLNSGWKII